MVIKSSGFLSGIIAQSCTLSMFLSFNYYISFYMQDFKHYSELEFGYVSFNAGLSFVLGCLLFRITLNKINTNRLSIICSLTEITMSVVLILLSYLQIVGMMNIIILTYIIIFCSGVMASENIGITMMFFPNLASIASCLHTAIHFIITSIFMYVLSLFSSSSLLVISCFYLIFTGIFFITNQYCYLKLNVLRQKSHKK